MTDVAKTWRQAADMVDAMADERYEEDGTPLRDLAQLFRKKAEGAATPAPRMLEVNDRITAPWPYQGNATIIAFRHYTGRHNGRTSYVADYITDDGKEGFDAVSKLMPLRIK